MEKQKAVLYCRVARLSDEEKEKENQVARFKELFGFEPTEIYTDISKSGRDNNRPEYRRFRLSLGDERLCFLFGYVKGGFRLFFLLLVFVLSL